MFKKIGPELWYFNMYRIASNYSAGCLVHALATGSATVNIYCLRRIVDFIVLLLFGTGCVDSSGSLSGGAFNQLKIVTLSIV